MPYFPDHNLLFIHIPKNGGKAIEVALGLAAVGALPAIGRRNVGNRMSTYLQRLTTNRQARERLHGTIDVSLCGQHLTLQEIALLGLDRDWGDPSPRSFAVFRDPLSRALSTFRHHTPRDAQTSEAFERFCASWYRCRARRHDILAHQRPQVDYLLDTRGKIGVDKVLLFESLGNEFAAMCREWGLACGDLPVVGEQAGAGARQVEISDRSRSLVESRFEEDFAFHARLCSTRHTAPPAEAPGQAT